MYYVSKTIEVAGAHSLKLSYESKCQHLHGHNWVITVYCRASKLNKDGMVCDFKHIKNKIHGYLDHGNLNELLPFNPTAENIAPNPRMLQSQGAGKQRQCGYLSCGRKKEEEEL